MGELFMVNGIVLIVSALLNNKQDVYSAIDFVSHARKLEMLAVNNLKNLIFTN